VSELSLSEDRQGGENEAESPVVDDEGNSEKDESKGFYVQFQGNKVRGRPIQCAVRC
jgi:hypothetical protein